MSQISAATFRVLRARANKEQRELQKECVKNAQLNQRVEDYINDLNALSIKTQMGRKSIC